MPRILTLASAAAAALCLANVPLHAQRTDAEWLDRCQHDRYNDDDRRERFCEVRVERVDARGTLTVDAHRNGGISVYGWDGDSIVVHARIQASARTEAAARDIAKDVRIRIDGTNLSADGPNTGRNEWWTVHFYVGVPRRQDVSLEVYNGPLAVEDIVGKIDVAARNGPVHLENLNGDVRARVRNGPLTVRLSGSRWEGQGLDAEATNGPVDLTIPSNYAAHLETGTTNGPMTIDFPITVQGRIPRDISTDLNGGGATIRVVTTNGPLVVRKN